MAGPSITDATYQPGPVPANPADLSRYLQDELAKIAAAIARAAEGNYAPTYTAPARPRAGMVRYCDGVHWNPIGDGDGWVGYRSNGTWVRLG